MTAQRKQLVASGTTERLDKVIKRLLDQAEAGDVDSAKLVLLYTVGPPDNVADAHTNELRQQELERNLMSVQALHIAHYRGQPAAEG